MANVVVGGTLTLEPGFTPTRAGCGSLALHHSKPLSTHTALVPRFDTTLGPASLPADAGSA
ncbi:acyl-coenzyme A:6-aminopenicillanic acid acyl-transferase domain protein [Anopheles sinensis]|uniref:Acyl-coenzyme A:6-aminopenicillanic acid acyl-transferase domain protein n=1 Tax=Anopheles sinensis TaxID=74873 RepID=A0A084WUN8_ANOSI|nr:acyl-coenzyme A:6-aminopenicillanic acid acyl-transferase domain protein [Anopheles sinensis]